MGAIMVRVITLTTKAANLVSIVTFNILGDITSTSKCIRFRNGKASTVPNQFHMATSRKCIRFRNGKASTCTVPNQVDMGGDRYTSSPNIESDRSGTALTMPVRMLAWSGPAALTMTIRNMLTRTGPTILIAVSDMLLARSGTVNVGDRMPARSP